MVADDIVTRLRELLDGPVPMTVERQDLREAAGEIERLRNAIFAIHEEAHGKLPSGSWWGAINYAVDLAEGHFKNCQCGERYD